ncbi:MAG: hypothetical protein CMH54_12495 [Myxococcales bacterium]|nr:hypothetical protein [Myxococcales bacterium]
MKGANLGEYADYDAEGPGANLTNANLTGADLTGVQSGGIRGKPRNLPKGWKLVKGYLIGPGAPLRNADLKGANLKGANLKGASLSGAYLEGAKLEGAKLKGVFSGRIRGKPRNLPKGWKLVNGTLVQVGK